MSSAPLTSTSSILSRSCLASPQTAALAPVNWLTCGSEVGPLQGTLYHKLIHSSISTCWNIHTHTIGALHQGRTMLREIFGQLYFLEELHFVVGMDNLPRALQLLGTPDTDLLGPERWLCSQLRKVMFQSDKLSVDLLAAFLIYRYRHPRGIPDPPKLSHLILDGVGKRGQVGPELGLHLANLVEPDGFIWNGDRLDCQTGEWKPLGT